MLKKPKKFDKLAFFVLTIGVTSTIPKTMIFINGFDERVMLAIYLQNLLSKYMKNDRKRLIRTFILILKWGTKVKYLEDFHNNNTKIWIYSDAIKIKVDIENII